MDSDERGMNPIAMTIINPRKECCSSQGSNQRPLVLKSYVLLTELWGLAQPWEKIFSTHKHGKEKIENNHHVLLFPQSFYLSTFQESNSSF